MIYREEIDFTQKPYEEWVRFLFDRDLKMRYEPIVAACDGPNAPFEYLTRLCGDLPALVQQYTWEKINRGLWAALMDPFWLSTALGNENFPLEPRAECVRAMKKVFSDVVAIIPAKVAMENIFYMWWEIIAKSCGGRAIQDIVFETLREILQLKEERCQMCALHGLGHCGHPQAPELVQRYLNRNRKRLDAERIEWIESCRDGTVM